MAYDTPRVEIVDSTSAERLGELLWEILYGIPTKGKGCKRDAYSPVSNAWIVSS